MKTLAIAMTLLLAPVAAAQAAPMKGDTMAARLQQLEDKAALKELVDTFSNLADRKDVQTQVLLFTEDATVESRTGGQPGRTLVGRQQLAQAFGSYLANFDTVYHINGQQTVEIDGDRATGTAYCLVVLIGNQGGKRMKNTSGVIYNDEYVRRDGRWLIAKRTSNFTWRESSEMPAPAS